MNVLQPEESQPDHLANAPADEQNQPTAQHLDEVAALIPAFAIGATDPHEGELVKRFLLADPARTAELSQFSALRDRLLREMPPVTAPPQLFERLRAATAPQATPATRQATAAAPRKNTLWERLGAFLTGLRWRPQWELTFATLLLLVVTNLFWFWQFARVEQTQQALLERLDQQDRALALVTGNKGQQIELRAVGAGSPAKALVVWDPTAKVAILRAEAFPALPQGQVYQLWLTRAGQRTSAGIFTVDAAGAGILVFMPPQPLTTFDLLGITHEPAGGSPSPTTSPVVRGKV